MKHILPILTAALLGAVVTASAQETKARPIDNFYYDYYLNPGISGVTTDSVSGRETDTVSYGDFAVDRFSQANNALVTGAGSNNANLYRITITGGDKDSGIQVKLYLTDFVKSLNGYDASQALYTNVAQYGYRILNADGSVKSEDYTIMPNSPDNLDAVDGGMLNENNGIAYRYRYELGTFDNGDMLEIYMAHRDSGNSAYSYNGLAESALGGYGDGGYYKDADGNVLGITEQTDGLLGLYHFNEALDGVGATEAAKHYDEYEKFDSDIDIAAKKAMPLAGLDIGYGKARIYFGIIGETVVAKEVIDGDDGTGTSGRPLPGGLQIALAAGLFGLGFCYVRRRKVIAE